MKSITIKKAHLHNLKNINISIPKNKIIVATGVSGSGKSSLVFDIIFEEGRRKYLQSLGILTGIEDEDKFESITGIGPAIAVQQNIIRQNNPRSTVGSRTQILNMLAVLYTGDGQIICRFCRNPVNDVLFCPNCENTEERLNPTYFSYNAPNGMCIKCSGRGSYFEIDMKKLIPEESVTLFNVFKKVGVTPGYMNILRKQFNDYWNMPFLKLPDEIQEEVINGHFVNSNYEKRSYCLKRLFEMKLNKFGEDPDGIYNLTACSECKGYRIGEEARSVLLNGKHIGELGKMPVTELQKFMQILAKDNKLSRVGKNLTTEIINKTNNLIKSRLGHLSLYREMTSLSGGEIQRLFLNSHLDSKMDSLIYILDEPTVGLHESEKSSLLKSIKELKEIGNTVIVVEHDKSTIEQAEYIIDIGPKAGIEGGEIIYEGNLAGLLKCKKSITGQYLSGKKQMPQRNINYNLATKKSKIDNNIPCLIIRNANTNNLKNVTASFPLGVLVGVAGVSGSGKSSLISNTLIPLLKGYFHNQEVSYEDDIELNDINEEIESDIIETKAERIEGADFISGYAEVLQGPIGRNSNSTPASYTGIWEKIRVKFSGQPEAKRNNLSAGHFSFNSKGACPKCKGDGREKIWLGGNIFIFNTCKECHGKRYNDESLTVKYKNKNILDVLEMSVSEALFHFCGDENINSTLKVLDRIGMGYIKLGQPTPTLSGGEAQRIKLAKEIGRKRRGNILYVMDEPTTGLSLYDTAKLIELLDELVTKGNSVIIIEHDLTVLSVCDWIIELGPGGGNEGGKIIAEGSPLALKKNPKSVTAKYLRMYK